MKKSSTKKLNRSKYSIAVTSVGGGVGQSLIKALKLAGYRVVGLDADPLAAGLYAVDAAYIIPHVSNRNYLKEVSRICHAEKCSLLFPGSDTELLTLSKHRNLLADIGGHIIVSSTKVIQLADDKYETAELLKKLHLASPKTQLLSQFLKKAGVPFPVVIKPKTGGSRSKNMFIVKSKNDLTKILAAQKIDPENFVAQEFIDGEEYTCGTVNWDNKCHGVIVMSRILRDGDTHKCFVKKNPVIETAVRKIVEELKPFGGCNVQLRLKNGIPYVFEINSRSSGTTGARAIAGFNEPGMITDHLLFNLEPKYKIKELSILRYWKELVVQNENIEQMKSKGFLQTSKKSKKTSL